MAKEIQDQKRAMVALRKNTEEISQAVQYKNLDQIIQKSKELDSNAKSETKRTGKDKATLQLIEQIRKSE